MVKIHDIKVEKHGLKLPSKSSELTTAQKEVLHLLTDEFLTIKQIAQRRHSSIQAVYKITAQIEKKGKLGYGLNKVEKVESTFNQSDVRLHGQEFNIRILWQDNKYQELLEKSNTLFLDSNSIRLYKNSIEIYSGQSFYGKSANISESKSLSYWQSFLAHLEHDLKVIILKPRARNIKIVNQHYARGNSEIAEDSIKNRERVWVYAEEDGKLAFITDDSFGFQEDETIHPITAKLDRKAVDKQVNDWRLNNPPTNSELKDHIKDLLIIIKSDRELIKDLPITINKLEQQISSHLSLIKTWEKESKARRKLYLDDVRKIKDNLNNGTQKSLFDFK